MKNIYIAFYYNKRSKTIHIKGGSTSLEPRLRMQMHFAQGTANQHSYPNVLNEDDLVYTRQFKHFLNKEQKVINTIRFFADLVESKGYNAKLHHAPSSHGCSNPNPNVTDIDRVILKFLFKTLGNAVLGASPKPTPRQATAKLRTYQVKQEKLNSEFGELLAQVA